VRGEAKEDPLDLLDKIRGGTKLAEKELEDLFLNLGCEELRNKKFTLTNMAICGPEFLCLAQTYKCTLTREKVRVSFIFKEQIAIMTGAYCALEVDSD